MRRRATCRELPPPWNHFSVLVRAARDRFLNRAPDQSFLHGEERLDELLRRRRLRRMKCQAAWPDADIKLRAFDRKVAVRTMSSSMLSISSSSS